MAVKSRMRILLEFLIVSLTVLCGIYLHLYLSELVEKLKPSYVAKFDGDSLNFEDEFNKDESDFDLEWFVQVSDVHLASDYDRARSEDFR